MAVRADCQVDRMVQQGYRAAASAQRRIPDLDAAGQTLSPGGQALAIAGEGGLCSAGAANDLGILAAGSVPDADGSLVRRHEDLAGGAPVQGGGLPGAGQEVRHSLTRGAIPERTAAQLIDDQQCLPV